jgi:hypothetical protein
LRHPLSYGDIKGYFGAVGKMRAVQIAARSPRKKKWICLLRLPENAKKEMRGVLFERGKIYKAACGSFKERAD